MKNLIQTQKLLAALASGEPVSGAGLAKKIGVTRAAIWKHIAALRKAGLPVQAQAGRGYSLPWPIELLDLATIHSHHKELSKRPIELIWETDSTQNRLIGDATYADLTTVLAEVQHTGRARGGKSWPSPPGLNIYLSCIKYFEQGFAGLSGLPTLIGLAVAQALTDVGLDNIGLHWPNDIMLGPHKIGGVIIHLNGEYQGPCTAVTGVGINMRLPEQAQIPALAQLIDTLPSRNHLAAELIYYLHSYLEAFARTGFAPFMTTFDRFDRLHGKNISAQLSTQTITGQACGINPLGQLCLDENGTFHAINSGPVRLI